MNHLTPSALSRRNLLFGAGAGIAALGLGACANPDQVGKSSSAGGSGSSDGLVVYDGGGAWGAAQRKAYFEPFQKETGIKLTTSIAPPSAQLKAAIEAGKPGMDVIDLNGSRVATWAKTGLIQKIDYGQWDDTSLKAKFHPYPALEYAVPSLIFAVQLAYSKKALGGGDMTRWADLWDASFPGKRSLYPGNGPGGCTLEIALLADGVKPKDLYPLDVDRALAKIGKLRSRVLKFWESGAESVQLLTDGEISALAAWNGRIQDAVGKGADVQSTFNQAILQVDYWAIPKGSKNVEGALRFIEFCSRPDRQAEFAKLITYAPTTQEAYRHISDERQKLLATSQHNLDKTIPQDNDFWGSSAGKGKTQEEMAIDRWQKWLTKA
ncbi:ABC transporter substrate-binding protein [Streptomyces sp. LZ34]